MANIQTINKTIGLRMMDIVLEADYRARLDPEMDTFVEGWDSIADSILGRMWDVYVDLDEAKIDGDNWLVELTCSELDYDAILDAAYNDMSDDKVFEKVMCHTFFAHDCYNSLRDALNTIVNEGGDTYYGECSHRLSIKGALYQYVRKYIDECDVRWETAESELIDDIVSQDW
ncbi:MAG: hypothetical protein IKL53_10150 [Lachnospiraceae bacterium]|nr:hypothetical protein [Lachnospiraceae bacterium]